MFVIDTMALIKNVIIKPQSIGTLLIDLVKVLLKIVEKKNHDAKKASGLDFHDGNTI